MHSLLTVNRNRQLEISAPGAHDVYSSISNLDTDISLTQQMQSFQDPISSTLDSSLPPLVETPRHVNQMAFIFTPLSKQSNDCDQRSLEETSQKSRAETMCHLSPISPNNSMIQPSSDLDFDSLLDNSILEEADRIEKEALHSAHDLVWLLLVTNNSLNVKNIIHILFDIGRSDTIHITARSSYVSPMLHPSPFEQNTLPWNISRYSLNGLQCSLSFSCSLSEMSPTYSGIFPCSYFMLYSL